MRKLIRMLTLLLTANAAAAAQGGEMDKMNGWQMAPPLPEPMGEIVGAVVQDRWYVIGGLDTQTHRPSGVVYLFDPPNGRWSQKHSMPVPAHHVAVAALNGRIYVMGGFVPPESSQQGAPSSAEAGWQPTNRSWVYDPNSDTWQELTPAPTPRGAGWAVALNNRIYVIGGTQSATHGNPAAPLSPQTPQRVLGTTEEYDPSTNHWRECAPMSTPRNHLIAAAVNGRIYAIGGRLNAAQITVADDTDVIEEYDPPRDQWTNKGRAPIRSSGMAGGAFDGRIYVAGGELQDWEGAKAYWAVYRYDPATGSWDALPRMQLAHHGFASGFLGGAFHVAGGGFQSDGMPGVNTKTATHEVLQLSH